MVATDGLICVPSTVTEEYVTGPKVGMLLVVETAPNCTKLGAVVAPTELAVSFTDVVVSVAVTDVPDGVSETEMEMASPPATGKRNDAVPAAPDTKVMGVPLMHCT